MSDNKRYYWLKLEENFFEDDTIAWLEEQENGKDYVIFYLKLALKSLKDDGRLIRYVGETLIPYDVKALAKLTNTSPDTVAVSMKTFLEIGLVSQLESGEIYLNQIEEMVGSETDVAKRVRKHRAKKTLEKGDNKQSLQSNADETKSNTELELEKELEKDKEGSREFAKPAKYADDSRYMSLAKRLYDHIKKRNPKQKEPNWQTWADDFRKTIELDKRDFKEAVLVLDWCQRNEFWQNNILSPAKFRKQYDQLFLKMDSDQQKTQGKDWENWDFFA